MASPTIEDIILQSDMRNMTSLRPHLPADFATESAQLLLDHPGKVLIVTGFYILAAAAPETDGPPGAAGIGEALSQIGYEVAYVTDKFSKDAMESNACGKEVIEFPLGTHNESSRFANELIRDWAPTCLVSIERAGLVGDGTYRNWKGLDFSPFNAKIDHLFDQHPYSVGIGDGGNEIGMGNLRHIIPDQEGLPDDPMRHDHDQTHDRKLLQLGRVRAGSSPLVAQRQEPAAVGRTGPPMGEGHSRGRRCRRHVCRTEGLGRRPLAGRRFGLPSGSA